MNKRCPTPHKLRYPSKYAANRALGSCWRGMRGTHMPTRFYRCPCGHWHLTHQPRWRSA